MSQEFKTLGNVAVSPLVGSCSSCSCGCSCSCSCSCPWIVESAMDSGLSMMSDSDSGSYQSSYWSSYGNYWS